MPSSSWLRSATPQQLPKTHFLLNGSAVLRYCKQNGLHVCILRGTLPTVWRRKRLDYRAQLYPPLDFLYGLLRQQTWSETIRRQFAVMGTESDELHMPLTRPEAPPRLQNWSGQEISANPTAEDIVYPIGFMPCASAPRFSPQSWQSNL